MDPCSPRAPARNSLPLPPLLAQYRPLLPHGPAEDLLTSNTGVATLIPATLRPNFCANASGGAVLVVEVAVNYEADRACSGKRNTMSKLCMILV